MEVRLLVAAENVAPLLTYPSYQYNGTQASAAAVPTYSAVPL